MYPAPLPPNGGGMEAPPRIVCGGAADGDQPIGRWCGGGPLWPMLPEPAYGGPTGGSICARLAGIGATGGIECGMLPIPPMLL